MSRSPNVLGAMFAIAMLEAGSHVGGHREAGVFTGPPDECSPQPDAWERLSLDAEARPAPAPTMSPKTVRRRARLAARAAASKV